MITAGLICASLAALVHVFIFYLESIAWTGDKARAVFGTTPAEAEATKTLAFNQGFYNLFLAIVSALGIAMLAYGASEIGATLIFAGTGSMLAAAIVLFITSPDNRSAALKQGTFPLLSVVLLASDLILS